MPTIEQNGLTMAKTPDAVKGLVCAAGMGDLDLMREILKRSPAAAHDWRPIMEASYKGFASVAALLAKHGSDVNAISSSEHNRPLHRAIEQGASGCYRSSPAVRCRYRSAWHMAPSVAVGEGRI
jgi:ankyrin repeat protein